MQDRRGIGQPRRLDNNPIELHNLTATAPREQVRQCHGEVAADSAAQAAVIEFDNILVAGFQQDMIQTHRAKFVDDDRRARHTRIADQPRQQGRLAAAQKPGQDVDGN